MNTSKDFIKFRQYIRTQNLKVNEQYLLEYLFEYTNTTYGYAFPKFSDIMSAFSTTSKNRISSTIKKLEHKGLIKTDRDHSNNRYYVIGIENFINQSKPKDSNGKPPLNGQVHFAELTLEESKVIELTNFTQKQAQSLLQLSKNKLDKVIATFKYAVKNGASNPFGYIKFLLAKNIDVDDKVTEYKKKSIAFVDNCSSRNYDEAFYENLEERLLGWT